jgi:hypothetical protein
VKYVGINYFTGTYTYFVFLNHHQMSSGPLRSCKAYVSHRNIYFPVMHTGQYSVRKAQKQKQYTDNKDGLNYCFKTSVINSQNIQGYGTEVPNKIDVTNLIRRLSTFPSVIMISSLEASVSVGSPGMSPPGRALPRLYHSP